MSRKITAACLAVAVLGGLAYYSSYLYSIKNTEKEDIPLQEQLQAEQPDELLPEELAEEQQEVSSAPASVQAETESKTESKTENETENYAYYLVEEFGYVNIYLADKESIYEYTDITIDSLPEDLQLEICTGKGIADEQELYDFLENYSS